MDLLVRHYKMPAPTLLPEKLMWGWVVPECMSPLLHRCDSSAVFSLYTEDLILNCKTVSNTVNSKKQSVSVCVSKHLITFLQLQQGWGWRRCGAHWWCTEVSQVVLELDTKEDCEQVLSLHLESGCTLSFASCPVGQRGGSTWLQVERTLR